MIERAEYSVPEPSMTVLTSPSRETEETSSVMISATYSDSGDDLSLDVVARCP